MASRRRTPTEPAAGLTPDEALALVASYYASDFRAFVGWAWPLVSNDPFLPGYHVDAICEHGQAVADGFIRRLACLVGVRHSKSLLWSVLWPAWRWAREPSRRVITGTYSQDLTLRDANRTRLLVQSPQYRALFPVGLRTGSDRQDYYKTTAGGERLSVSIGSRTSGFDADTVVVDDIHDLAQKGSKVVTQAAVEYATKTLLGRLVLHGREDAVICGHRVRDDDVFGHLRATYGDSGEWSWLVLPEEARRVTWFNALGWTDRRADGELLWPERYDAARVAELKQRYRHDYAAVFLQQPQPAEGNLFDPRELKAWVKTDTGYDLGGRPVVADGQGLWGVTDLAVSTKTSADWTCCGIFDAVGADLVILHWYRARLDGAAVVPWLAAIAARHRLQVLGVESVAGFKVVADQLRAAGVPVRELRPRKDKQSTSVAAQTLVASGQVWVPADAPWVADLSAELAGFPNAAHDDQVDVLSNAAILAPRLSRRAAAPEPTDPPAKAQKAAEEAAKRYKALLEADGG